jgi:hypothetical protein
VDTPLPVDDMFDRLLEVTLVGPQGVVLGSNVQYVAIVTNDVLIPF